MTSVDVRPDRRPSRNRRRRSAWPATAAAFLLTNIFFPVGSRAYVYQYADSAGTLPLRWPSNVVIISFSSSLGAPPANIKAGSDVIGAARRALARWAEVTGFLFVEATSSAQSISPAAGPDGVNLITVAQTAENSSLFAAGAETTGRTRVFFNPVSGAIAEADITINPVLQYSTDGTPGTYDLEATFTHEVGHLLGLDHSAIVGATMQPLQGRNGNYNLPALTTRTLSSDDRAGARALYNLTDAAGSISGTVTTADGAPVYGAHVWAESLTSGRVAGGAISKPNGGYAIENLAPDNYRVIVEYLNGPITPAAIAFGNRLYAGIVNQPSFATAEANVPLSRRPFASTLNLTVNAAAAGLNPQLFGINGQLSTSPVPLAPGNVYRFYVAGPGVDQLSVADISALSPSISIVGRSLRAENLGAPFPIISFDVRIADDARPADYSLRLRAGDGQTAYLVGAISVDTDSEEAMSRPPDADGFFVRQNEAEEFKTWPGASAHDHSSMVRASGYGDFLERRKPG